MRFTIYKLLAVAICLLPLRVVASEILDFPSSDIARVGIYIEDLASGKIVVSNDENKVFVPASVMKCITAASVQSIVPSDFRFVTTVNYEGIISNRTLQGNIVVKGSGDPTLSSRFFADVQPDFVKKTTEYVKSLGIDSIAGEIIIDGSCRSSVGVSPFWLQEDCAWEYGAGLFGINFRDNSFTMTLSNGASPKTSFADIEIQNNTTNGGNDDIVAMRGYDSSVLTITGTLTSKYTSRYSMPSPAVELVEELTRALDRSGIKLGYTDFDQDCLAQSKDKYMRYHSPGRDEILRVMMYKSNNLFAEGMLRAINSDCTLATKREYDLWSARGVSLKGARWLDGSGLSPVERVSPATLGQILSYMSKSKYADAYLSLFPLAGRDGTVKNLLKDTPLQGKFAFKSGSMNGVKCYAGYKLNESGVPTHVVVIMVNGFSCKGAAVTKAIERFLIDEFS